MSIYLDTSCLLKLLFLEPETSRVLHLVSIEDRIIVSSLVRIETLVQLHGRLAGGHLPRPVTRALLTRLDAMLKQRPYFLVRSPGDFIEAAERQVRSLPRAAHCPTLDRLHLAVMKSLGLDRLLTNDVAQARAARALGFSVTVPH